MVDVLRSTPTQLLIGGRWVDASDGATIDVIDPATGAAFTSVAAGSVDDARAAVAAAAAAGPDWAATSPRERGEILRRAYEAMTARTDELAELIVRENGKALPDARAEVAYAAEFFRWFSEEAVRNIGSFQRAPGGTNRILVNHKPVGVCLLITPWNFPAAMATRKIGPALAAGCTVILKPASSTPLTALAIGAILAEAGAPDGVVNVLAARSTSAFVDAVLADDRVRKVSFTGSTEVGRGLLAKAADKVVNSSMELGGNAPFLVLDDADLDAAIEGAMLAKMRNGGEACTAANRFYVHRSVADEFVARLTNAMSALPVGNGLDDGVRLGPLVDEDTRTKVHDLVSATVAAGAVVRCGGALPEGPGYFYPATVLDEVPAEAPVLRQEIFGPVAPVVRFDSDDEAIAAANDTEFGLVAYLYTGDLARGLRLAERLEAGMVGLNRGLVSDPAAPFGGVKQSGIGREGGHEGLLEYVETQYIATDW